MIKSALYFLFLLSSVFLFSQGKQTMISESKISEIKNFVNGKKQYNQDIAMFIDFRIPSSKFRFFIFDLKNNKILDKGIVAHGSGSEVKNSTSLKFSNVEGSYQSSLGKYEINNSYVGQFGKSYRLKGLDTTNSNAMQRAIVMHRLSCVKDTEDDTPTCLSLGCPMLSEKFFKKAESYIDASKNTIILYAYY